LGALINLAAFCTFSLPCCPWHFVHDNRLSKRVFKSYDDIVDHCCEAWNKLTAQLWRVMSIGTR
jgi:hypothetical protein